MKTFIVAIITLTVLITGVAFNCIYITNTVDALLSAVDALPKDAENSSIAILKQQWDICKNRISLTVDHKETDEIDDTISQIEVHIYEKNQSAYASAVVSLKCQLLRLAESEALSIGRIF